MTQLSPVFIGRWPESEELDQWPPEPEAAQRAPSIIRALLDRTGKQRDVYLRNSRLACTWPVVEGLIRENRRHLSDDSSRAVAIAEIAVQCAQGATDYPEPIRRDLETKAFAQLCKAHRRDGDFEAGELALAETERSASRGSGHPAIYAEVVMSAAWLARDRGRLTRALELFDVAIALAEMAGLGHLSGRLLYEKSLVLRRLGCYQEAISDLHVAFLSVRLDQEPRLGYVILSGLALTHEAAGRPETALRYLKQAVQDWSFAMNSADHARVSWTRGRICVQLGNVASAAEAFTNTRDAFIRLGNHLGAATVALELAELLADLGRFREVRDLAAEMLSVFRTVGVQREVEAAFCLLQKAESAETVREVAATIERLTKSDRSRPLDD